MLLGLPRLFLVAPMCLMLPISFGLFGPMFNFLLVLDNVDGVMRDEVIG